MSYNSFNLEDSDACNIYPDSLEMFPENLNLFNLRKNAIDNQENLMKLERAKFNKILWKGSKQSKKKCELVFSEDLLPENQKIIILELIERLGPLIIVKSGLTESIISVSKEENIPNDIDKIIVTILN